jgi:hypothetical protein
VALYFQYLLEHNPCPLPPPHLGQSFREENKKRKNERKRRGKIK